MPSNTENFVKELLSHTKRENHYSSMSEWFSHFNEYKNHLSSPLDQAILGGRLSNNMGFAFSAGYQSAIQSLFAPKHQKLASLCISEPQGNHPRAIQSTLIKHGQNWHLNGSKSFITGATEAEILYVAVTTGLNTDNRPIIKMLALPANQPGIHISNMPPLPFIPEISHGTATFTQVRLDSEQILDGDGYSKFVKPFRTYEDIHVLAAVIGYRIGEAIDSNWTYDCIEEHLSLLASLRSLRPNEFSQTSSHLILAGCRSQLKKLIQQTDEQFELNNAEGYKNWKRDKALLDIASKAHKLRTNRAWDFFEKNDS